MSFRKSLISLSLLALMSLPALAQDQTSQTPNAQPQASQPQTSSKDQSKDQTAQPVPPQDSAPTPIPDSTASGSFPPLVFLQLLFGHRSIEGLRQAFPDVWVSDEARPVLKALFPTRPSFVFGW